MPYQYYAWPSGSSTGRQGTGGVSPTRFHIGPEGIVEPSGQITGVYQRRFRGSDIVKSSISHEGNLKLAGSIQAYPYLSTLLCQIWQIERQKAISEGSTLRALASFLRVTHFGTCRPFSILFMVLGLTPANSAKSSWLSALLSLNSFNVFIHEIIA